MKTFKWLYIIAIILLAACSDNNNSSKNRAGRIKSVSAKVSEDNALRVDVKVEFSDPADFRIEYWKTSDPSGKKMTNLYKTDTAVNTKRLVFLEPDTEYTYSIITDFSDAKSQQYTFTTGKAPFDMPTIELEYNKEGTDIPGYILFDRGDIVADKGGYIIVTNTMGKVVWYEPIVRGVKVVNFDEKTNTFTALTGANPNPVYKNMKNYTAEYLQVTDIYGNVILKKDVKDLSLHHDTRMLPNGDLISASFNFKEFDLSSIGGTTKDTVVGDGFTIIGIDGTVKKIWNFFEDGKLNPVKDTKLISVPGRINDWIHVNSVNFDSNGDYYMTSRELPGLWKVDGRSWKLLYHVARPSDGGDVTASDDKYYANGLHSAYPIAPNKVMVLDNATLSEGGRPLTRSMLYNVDEANKTATVDMQIIFPQIYQSQLGSNAKIIGDDLLIYGARNANTVLFTDFKGAVLRSVVVSHLAHRAEYIKELKY